jgi:transcriptional regulator with XRE-family HTH domain
MEASERNRLLSARLRRRRFELGERQKVIAARAGITSQFLSRLENGAFVNVNPDVLPRLAEALKTTTDYLLGRSDDPDRSRRLTREALVGA